MQSPLLLIGPLTWLKSALGIQRNYGHADSSASRPDLSFK